MKHIIRFDWGEVRNSTVNEHFDNKRHLFLELLMGERKMCISKLRKLGSSSKKTFYFR